MYAKYDIARLTTDMYLSDLTPAMKPSDAYAHIALRKTERVEIDHLEGRITVGLVTPYPPGIPLLIPGECFNRKIALAVTAAKSPHDDDHRHPLGDGRGEEPHRTCLGHVVRATADSDSGRNQSAGEPGTEPPESCIANRYESDRINFVGGPTRKWLAGWRHEGRAYPTDSISRRAAGTRRYRPVGAGICEIHSALCIFDEGWSLI